MFYLWALMVFLFLLKWMVDGVPGASGRQSIGRVTVLFRLEADLVPIRRLLMGVAPALVLLLS